MIGFFKNIMANGVLANTGLSAFAVLALSAALTAQHGFGMQPCILCLYQRIPYAIIAVLGLAGSIFALKKYTKAASLTMFLSALAFLAGGGIAFYHTGVEQHWWASAFEGCKVTFPNGTATEILKMIEAAKAVPCDKIAWSLFGISMAGYNAILSFIAAPLCALSALLILRRANNGQP